MSKRRQTIAAFVTRADAEALAGKLAAQGIEAHVDEVPGDAQDASDASVFQVQVLRRRVRRASIFLSAQSAAPQGPQRRQFNLQAVFAGMTVACVVLASIHHIGVPRTIGAAMFLILGAVFSAAGVAFARRGRASLAWPQVRGTIERAYLEKDDEGGYRPRVSYRFHVDDGDYTADDLGYRSHPATYAGALQVLVRFPAGREVDVFYDPGHPASAVLERGIERRDAVIAILLGIVSAALGIGFLLGWIGSGLS